MNKYIKKFLIIRLFILILIVSNIYYTKEVLALAPPPMAAGGRQENIITPNNAILYVLCENASKDIVKIEMVLYTGYKGEQIGRIEKNVDSNLSWIHVRYDVKKEMGIELQSGKQYYVQYQAIGKNGMKGSGYTNGNLFVTPNVEVTAINQNVEEDNLSIKMSVTGHGSDEILKVGLRVTCFGCIVGTMEKQINQQADDLSIDFDLKNEGKMNLLPNCNYQYNAYVVTRSLSGWKNEGRVDTYGSFKTLEGASITKGTNRITKRNVLLCGKLLNPRGKDIEKYGLIIKKGNKVIGQCKKSYPVSEKNATRKQLKFNIKKDMKKIKLIKGKKYKYEIYSFVGGKKYATNGALKIKKTIIKR